MTIEAKTERASTVGKARIKFPFAPDSKVSGRKAKTTASVDVTIEPHTSFVPRTAPSIAESPLRYRRKMLSLTTIASSTKIPKAMIAPIIEIWFKSTPVNCNGIKAIKNDNGIARLTIIEPENVKPIVVTAITAIMATINSRVNDEKIASTAFACS